MDALNGPVGQLGVPLAAAGLSAAFPRRGAPAVHAGLGALGAMQDYKTNNMRLQELTHQRDQREGATRQFVKSLGDASGENTQGVSGNVPAADNALKSSTQDAGVTPRIHGTQMPPELANSLRLQAMSGDSEGAMREAAHFYASQGTAEAHREPLISSTITNEYGDQVKDVIDPNPGGSQRQFYMGGPAPAKPANLSFDEQGYAEEKAKNPALTRIGYLKMKGDVSRQPVQGNFQQATGQAGEDEVPLTFDAHTGQYRPAKLPSGVTGVARTGQLGQASQDDVEKNADGIMNGTLPPLTGNRLGKDVMRLRAAVQRRGGNLTQMSLDYTGYQKAIATMNDGQQTKQRQGLETTGHQLEIVEDLYNQFKQLAPGADIRVINRATLAAAKQFPGDLGAVAQALESQIADFTAGLGTVYMGGNAPTDHSLELASKNLGGDWTDDQFKKGVSLAKQVIAIRKSAMATLRPAGVSQNSVYNKSVDSGVAPPTPESGQATPAGGQFKYTATGPKGEKVGSNDGVTWQPLK